MPLQNFVAKTGPAISAVWLNAVDVLKFTIFGDATTPAQARTNLTLDAPLEVANGGTGTRGSGASFLAFLASFFPSIYQYINPITPEETAASVVPVDYSYLPGDIRRWGPALDGITDDTVPLTNWAKVTGRHTFPVAQTALITAHIPLVSNSTFEGVEGATIQTATHDISMFTATGKSRIKVRGLHFKMTSVGAAANVGGVAFDTCSSCVVRDCEFEGMQFSGVYGTAISRCTFGGNYIHDALGTGQDSADIYVTSSVTTTASYNVIDGNFCDGATFEFGIAVWDPYSGVLPIHNIVCNNRVKAHNGYGILIYMPDIGDSFNQVIGNHVQDISAHSTNTDSGAGIYLAGAGIGGTVVMGNTVQNCCITTSTASLAPAGIGVNTSGAAAGGVPIVIEGNVVEGMTRYHGILLTGLASGASVIGNTVRHPIQTGAIGDAIRVANCNNVALQGNVITNLATTLNSGGITLAALGAGNTNISVVGNTITGGHASQIRCLQTGGSQTQNLTISGNLLSGGDNSCIPLTFDSASAVDVMVSGNVIRSGNAAAVSQIACTNIRYSTNFLNGTGTAILSTSGACTGSYYDKTNFGTGNGAGVVNAGTGFIIEQLGAAAPVAGTWAVGDRIEQSVPVVGNPKGWRCTVAGAGGGTFVSEGNL